MTLLCCIVFVEQTHLFSLCECVCCSLDEVVVVQFFYPDHTSDFTEREKKYRNAGECRELLEAKKTQKKKFRIRPRDRKKIFF